MVEKITTIKLNEDDIKIIDDIKRAKGLSSTTTAIRLSLREFHDKIFLNRNPNPINNND